MAEKLYSCPHIEKLLEARGKVYFPQNCSDLNADEIVSQDYFQLLWEYRNIVMMRLRFLSDRNKGYGEMTFSCVSCKVKIAQKLAQNEIEDEVAMKDCCHWIVLPRCRMANFLDYIIFEMKDGSMKEQFLRKHLFFEAIETWMKKGVARPYTFIHNVSNALFECSSCFFNDRFYFGPELEQIFVDVWFRSSADLYK